MLAIALVLAITAGCKGPKSGWTVVNGKGTKNARAIAFGNDMFVMARKGGEIAVSEDGLTWTAIKSKALGKGNINAIAFGKDKFVAVGEKGRIVYSAQAQSTQLPGAITCLSLSATA